MPRVSKQAKALSHARIVDEAARQFREKGIEATGLSDIMKGAGLTHGGFYRHFSSKDDLAAAAISRSFDDILHRLETALLQGSNSTALADFIDMLLSKEHLTNPGKGCPIVALGAEAARGSEVERIAISQGIEDILERLTEIVGGDDIKVHQTMTSLLSLLVGTVVMARAMSSTTKSQAILDAGRKAAKHFVA